MTTAIEAGTPAADTPADSLSVPIRKTMLEKFLMG
ncbi:MAG: type VI secretion protein, partial [Ralstonia sp.]|nr:type VI secretion protein [Ralstonia sp.]